MMTEKKRLFFLLFFLALFLSNATAQNDSLEHKFKLHIDSGTVNIEQGDYPSALRHYFEALKLSKTAASEKNIAKAHSSLGVTYYRLHEWDTALEHLNTAEEIFEKLDDDNMLADVYYKKGIVYDEIPGETDKAFSYLQKALLIYKKENECQKVADIYNAIAGHYYMQRKTDSTAHYAMQALEKFEECGTLQQQAAMNINIASLLNSQRRHVEAVKYNQKGIELAYEANSYAQLRQGYKNLSETYAFMNQYEKAYENRVLFDQYKDSVFSAEKQIITSELSAKYEKEKKDLLLAEKENEIEQNKLRIALLAIGLLGTLIFAVMMLYISRQRKKRNKQLRELNATKDKLFSIISHDLKSPVIAQQKAVVALIDNLSSYNEKQILENLRSFQKAIDTQFDLLQNLLSWANMHTGRIKYNPAGFNINEVIRESANLYELPAHNKKIEIELELLNSCNVYADRLMIQTVIRNLVNNAIKYTHEGGKVTISCSCLEDSALISVKDNGVGMDADTVASVLGTGKRKITAGTEGETGSGLGLLISKNLLEQHASRLNIKSEAGKGSEISFKLTKINL